MARTWSVAATLVLLAFSLSGCDVACSIFGCDGMDGEPRSPPGPTPSPSPTPTPGDTTLTTTPGVGCSKAFATGCKRADDADDDACYILVDDAAKFPDCDKELQDHFADYDAKKKEGNSAINDLVLDGATGTCLTALRILGGETEKKCPMPMPPASDDIKTGGDSINILVLGDWGPTPQGRGVSNPGQCECPIIPLAECRDSLFNWLERAQSLCTPENAERSNNAQQLVADAMAEYATKAKPVAVLSLGDNFYIGGIPTPHNLEVGDGMGVTSVTAFEDSWNDVYIKNAKGDGLKVPWLSIMGNHDYGGAGCQADWQVQIDYSKKSEYWRMPYQYFKQRVKADSYLVDIFMLEVNSDDFLSTDESHSICSQSLCHYTPGGQQGDVGRCRDRVQAKQEHMNVWLEKELKFSQEAGVQWIVLVGHFPNGPECDKLTALGAKYGAALYIAGHTHSQKFYKKGSPQATNMNLLVSGAGGGYRQEGDGDFYGFANLAFSKDKLTVTIVGEDGKDHKGDDGTDKLEIAHEETTTFRRLNVPSPSPPSPPAKRWTDRRSSDRHTL